MSEMLTEMTPGQEDASDLELLQVRLVLLGVLLKESGKWPVWALKEHSSFTKMFLYNSQTCHVANQMTVLFQAAASHDVKIIKKYSYVSSLQQWRSWDCFSTLCEQDPTRI